MKKIISIMTVLVGLSSGVTVAQDYSENGCSREYNLLFEKVQEAISKAKPSRSLLRNCADQLTYYGDKCSAIASTKSKVAAQRDQMANAKWELFSLIDDDVRELGYTWSCGDYPVIYGKLEKLRNYGEREFKKMHYETGYSEKNGLTREKVTDGEYVQALRVCLQDLETEAQEHGCQ